MKKNLGKLVALFFILWHVELSAITYQWSGYSDKKEYVIGEAIYLKYECLFSENTELYSIDFHPESENELYSLKLLSEKERVVDNQRLNTYEFIAYAKKPMKLVFDFHADMKKTTRESIETIVIGRDNVGHEQFSITPFQLEKLELNIVENNTSLAGALQIKIKSDTNQVKAYEPFHLEIILQGKVNFEDIKPIEFSIEGVRIFGSKIKKEYQLTSEGYNGVWSQKFAFVGESNFTIPAIQIEYFDTTSKELKTLQTKNIDVEVQKAYTQTDLLDEVQTSELKFDMQYFYYLLFIIFGYLLGKIKFATKKSNNKKGFQEKIRNAKSVNEILMLLAVENDVKYKVLITEIESKKLSSLQAIQKKILH